MPGIGGMMRKFAVLSTQGDWVWCVRKVVEPQQQAVMNECGARGVGDRRQGLREGPVIVAVVAN